MHTRRPLWRRPSTPRQAALRVSTSACRAVIPAAASLEWQKTQPRKITPARSNSHSVSQNATTPPAAGLTIAKLVAVTSDAVDTVSIITRLIR
jgi:hypothetical protein